MIIEEIKKEIEKALKGLNLQTENIFIEHPSDLALGDYSTNIAMVLAKKVGEKPFELAKKVKEKIVQNIYVSQSYTRDFISKVEVAQPGFINFYLSSKFFVESVKKISEKVEIINEGKKEKVIVEYTDANPLKEFHIGHLMTNTIGEALAGLFEATGNEVKRVCYQGDVGMHIAKAVWGALKQKEEIGSVDWKTAYPKGAKAFEESESVKKEIEAINKKLYEKDESVFGLYEEGKKESLEKFELIYKKLGTKFDHYFFESEVADFGKKIVEENVGKIFEKSEGAIIFRGEEYGLHSRVFINSKGLPTYEAKELGLAKIKYDKFPVDKSIVVTGSEIIDYFRVVKKVIALIYPQVAEKIYHVPHGMLRLPSGKMSSRKGDVITGESLINEIKVMVLEKIKERNFSETEQDNVAEKVAVGAIKFSILKSASNSDIIFDFDKSISFEGDSGPYLQYSYARALSVLRKNNLGVRLPSYLGVELPSSNFELEKLLCRFSEVVFRAKEKLEPHFLANYLTDVAGAFNSFYANNKILDAGQDTFYRLLLTKAFANVMKDGMKILAIPILEKM